jgi:amidophosphoribosyltransferase
MADRTELVAAGRTNDEIAALTGAHSLAYLSLGGLQRAVDAPAEGFCRACFTGDYPIPIPDSSEKLRFEARGETTVAVPVP